MAAVLGETYPEIFAAVGVHSGLARGAASDVISAFAAMRGAPRPGGRARQGAADNRVPRRRRPDGAFLECRSRSSRALPAPVRRPRRGPVDTNGGRRTVRTVVRRPDGPPQAELWLVEGAGHAWSGGNAAGSYTDPSGPDASAEMVRFFLER